ncbi:hypothetical protein [uncultured Helicobacter sp.]|uniref:hypothetical protein n=1 Tax=uncultured Helicobacter sp. TaxID=175537 RepID=UPI00262C5A81|nr:hypothetical protein [uncultured Helicobacter sp.]
MKFKIEIAFSYLFFFLFVFVSLSLLVSTFWDSFSQLYALLTQSGRIFDFFLYGFIFVGFIFCIIALILSSWNQKFHFYYKSTIISLALSFAFILCFSLSGSQNNADLLDLVFADGSGCGFQKDPHAIMILTGMYLFFVFLPLSYLLLGMKIKNGALGDFLLDLMPSVNVMIYTLMGFALQGYFCKARGIYYLDLIFFVIGLIALLVLYKKKKSLFRFYEKTNMIFLLVGIVFFALSSKTLQEADFVGRYCFFAFAFVAWCGEWMLRFAKK